MEELLARIHATLRRSRSAATDSGDSIEFDGVVVDLSASLVTREGKQVRLTPTEFALLRHFVTNPNRLLSHAELLRRVWGPGYATETEYTRVYVRRLRSKLGLANEEYIVTEPRQGYRFVGPFTVCSR
jgi:two-component system KDP operon response regulator KdpE